MDKESKNENLNLIVLTIIVGVIFTLVISIVTFYWNSLLGMILTFLIIVSITFFVLTEIVKQKYDLLLSSPAIGQQVKPFVFRVFGKELWKYPKEGSFIFTPPAQPETPGAYDPMNRPKKKRYHHNAKKFAQEYYLEWNKKGVTQEDFAKRKGITAKTLRKYLDDFPIETFTQ